MRKQNWLWFGALAALAMGCSDNPSPPTELPPCAQDGDDSDCPGGWEHELEVTTYVSYPDHGTESTETVTIRELAERDPEFAAAISEKLGARGQARQALGYSFGAWTDNEVYYYDAVYPFSGDPSWGWATAPMLQAKDYLIEASWTTGIVISETGLNVTPRDGRIRLNTIVSSSCASGGVCELGSAGVAVSGGKISYTNVTIYIGNINHYYGASPNRAHATRKAMIHEVGHGFGLEHFTSAPLCSSTNNGTGPVCPWGSRPGGNDTVMSYCSPPSAQGFDGCELEELYWNVSPGTEL